MFNKILIVCTGNICRSPIAEALFNKHLPSLHVGSAGIVVTENALDGYNAEPNAIEVASAHGLDISQHHAKQITAADIKENDLILTMSQNHASQLAYSFSGAKAKTLLIGQWINVGHVKDPLGKSVNEFEECYTTLEKAVLSWKNRL